MTGDLLDTPDAGPRIIRGGAVRAAGYAGGILLGLISTPFMLRHLGVEDFGRFITVSSLIFIVGGLTEFGLSNIALREYSLREGRERRRLLQNVLGMRLALTLLGVLVAALFAMVVGYTDVMVAGALVAGAGLVIANLQLTFAVPLQADLRLGWVAALDFVRQAATATFVVILVVAGASLLPFFAVSVAAALIALVLGIVLVRREVSGRPAADPAEWWLLLRDTLPYAAATAIAILYFRIAVILMSLIAGTEETGYFGAAFRIIEIVSAIPWLLVTSAFPVLVRAARDDRDRLRYALQRLFEVSVIAGVWMALVVWVGAPFAIDVVGGDDYAPAVDPLRALGFAMISSFLVATWGLALLSLRRHITLLVTNTVALLLAAGATLVLEPALGATGAAIATAGAELVLALIYVVVLVRLRPDLLPSGRIVGRVALAAAAAIAPAIAFDLPSVALAGIATTLYFGVLLALKAIPTEVIEALLRRESPA